MPSVDARPPRFTKDHGTAFDRWRKQMNFTHSKCAASLGKSLYAIQCMARGKYYNGGPCQPTKTTRLLMSAIAQGYPADKPWPV